MTSELWELSLTLQQTTDESVLEAILFALVTLLEVNEESSGAQLPENHAKELLETQEWVAGIIMKGGAGEKVMGLAAAAMVHVGDMIKGFEKRMMGERMGMEY
jgi:telomere length regulation protein